LPSSIPMPSLFFFFCTADITRTGKHSMKRKRKW
jgi:hypothetical protein